MTNVGDVDPQILIEKTAKDLKDTIKMPQPDWSRNVKTGAHKQRQPEDSDWWWTRAASVLRKVYLDGPVGVQKLRNAYGGKKRRGVKPEKFAPASGKVIRAILQGLDEQGFTERAQKQTGLTEKAQGYEGRVITPKGQAYLDKIASQIK